MKKKIFESTAVFQEEKSGGYSVWVPELPGCASQGKTFEEAVSNVKEAMELYLEDNESELHEDYIKQFVVPIKLYA